MNTSTTPAPAPQLSPAKVLAATSQLLALEQIHPDPNQPRKDFDADSLKDLAASIAAEGLLQPIVVKPNGKGFYIVAGERRYRACKSIGLKEVPVLVREDLKDKDVSALQLVENVQRTDLTLPEQCDAVTKLVKTLGTARAAAEKLGKSEAWVSKRVTAAGARIEVRKLMDQGHIIDAEIATGLNELMSIADPKDPTVQDIIHRIKEEPNEYTSPVTREELRGAIADEKDAIKRREQQAAEKKAAKEAAKTSGKPAAKKVDKVDPKKALNAKWAALMPLIKKFAKDAAESIGCQMEGPTHYEWNPGTPPASVAAAEMRLWLRKDAEGMQKLASKTGLTLKLGFPNNVDLTPDQARKVEQIIGKKLVWSHYLQLKGSQVAECTKKLGKPVELPVLATPTPAAAKVETKKVDDKKPAAKKKARK